jgi:cytoskeletal protein RodZ
VAADERAAALSHFGRWLAQERELRGLGREEVARTTKLGAAIIEALEAGEPDRLPPRAYAVGYLRSYAAAVGLDADDLVLRYEEALGPGGAAPEAVRGSSGLRTAIAVALAVAVVAAGIWALLAR